MLLGKVTGTLRHFENNAGAQVPAETPTQLLHMLQSRREATQRRLSRLTLVELPASDRADNRQAEDRVSPTDIPKANATHVLVAHKLMPESLDAFRKDGHKLRVFTLN